MAVTASARSLRSDARPTHVRVSDVLTGLSRALDVTEGHPQGHAARSCLIGMRLARMIGLGDREQGDLFYALLLKDAGCSSNAARVHQLFGGNDHEAKRAVWLKDWRRFTQKAAYAAEYAGRGEPPWRRLLRVGRLAVAGPRAERELFQIRCDRGASIAVGLGLSHDTASAIRTMDEHWDGGGQPAGLRGDQIPVAGRIIGLAQVLEIFAHEQGPDAALAVAHARSGRWFDPELVQVARSLAGDDAFWQQLALGRESDLVAQAEPVRAPIVADDGRLDLIAEAFASVIDAKSPYTCDHSRRVARFATAIGRQIGLEDEPLQRLRRAALLHDIGKLGVPNSILDKTGKLTRDEWTIVRRHPAHTWAILNAVPVFTDFAFDASCHHEKLDGTGYHAGVRAPRLSTTARVLAVADICDALLADRPYRPGMSPEDAAAILETESRQGALCGESVAAACHVIGTVAAEQSDETSVRVEAPRAGAVEPPEARGPRHGWTLSFAPRPSVAPR